MSDLCKCGCGRELPARVRIRGRFQGPKRQYFEQACRLRVWRSKKVLVDRADLERIVKDYEGR